MTMASLGGDICNILHFLDLQNMNIIKSVSARVVQALDSAIVSPQKCGDHDIMPYKLEEAAVSRLYLRYR